MTYTFIITHFGAGSTALCRILDQNPKISALGSSELIYDHPTKLDDLRRGWTKQANRYIGVEHYIDRLRYNHQITNKCFYNICNFIYLLREPTHVLPHVMANGYKPEAAADYYAFRLRRMCEMFAKTPQNKSILITYDQLIDENQCNEKFKQIENMLNLRIPLKSHFTPRLSDKGSLLEGKLVKCAKELDEAIPQELLHQSRLVYDKYLEFFIGQNYH